MLSRPSIVFALALPFASLACGDASSSCPSGAEGCPCLDEQCLGELACRSGMCVDASDADETDGAASGEVGEGEEGPSEGSSSDGGTETSGSVGESEEEPGGPMFLSFGVNSTTVLEGDMLVFAAVLTDPDGIDDIVGGTLLDPASGATYGAFATSASEGAYQATLQWDDLQTVQSIDGPIAGVERLFRAEFFDTAGHVAAREVTVRLDCPEETGGLCGGTCRNFVENPETCGACDHVCFLDQIGSVDDRACADSQCYALFSSNELLSCDDVCAERGAACASPPTETWVGTADTTDGFFPLTSCDQQSPAATTVWIQCWCREI
jgi:hypothetical protein